MRTLILLLLVSAVASAQVYTTKIDTTSTFPVSPYPLQQVVYQDTTWIYANGQWNKVAAVTNFSNLSAKADLSGATFTGPITATKVQGEGAWTYAYAVSDSANSTRAAASQHTGLALTLTANDTLEVEWKVYYTSAATATGLCLMPKTSGAVTSIRGYSTAFGSGNDGTDQQLTGSHTASNDTVVYASTQVANAPAESFTRFLIITGASERTLQFWFKSEITASAVTIKAPSYARKRKWNPQVW